MLFSELLASILNGKKKQISVAVVKKKTPDIYDAFSQGVTWRQIGVSKQWNFYSFEFAFSNAKILYC